MRAIRELISYMSGKSFGTLANLAKILEEASDPESLVREDKRESKPKTKPSAKSEDRKKPIDPKRKAWYEKRLREQAGGAAKAGAIAPLNAPDEGSQIVSEATRTAAAGASSGLLDVLASAKDAKPKGGPKRPEAWKRKPSDPFF